MNSFHNLLAKDARFRFENGLFYQKDVPQYDSFEENYLRLRHKEGRVYTDDVVQLLPTFHGAADLSTEWKIRKRSADRLIHYLKIKKGSNCNRGWLRKRVAHQLPSSLCCCRLLWHRHQ